MRDRVGLVVSILVSGAIYNVVELLLVVLVGLVHIFGGDVWAPVLWLSFIAAAVWTVLASTADFEDEAHELVMYREVFYTDFLVGAFLLMVLSAMTVQYGLLYGVIFVVATVQNLRYSAMAYNWLETQDEDTTRDNMP